MIRSYRLYTVCERKGWAQETVGYTMRVAVRSRVRKMSERRRVKGERKLL